MHTVRTLAKGQIIIPVETRQRFGIKPGGLIEIREAGDHLELYPLPDDPGAAFRGSLKADTSLADELIREHRQELSRNGG
jgi:AbrB family looped-hinge helix DNA binding protein